MSTLFEKAQIMDAETMKRSLARIAHEIIERNNGTEDLVFIGIRRRGVPLAKRLSELVSEFEGVEIPMGILDITLYRDDLTTRSEQPVVHTTEVPFGVQGKKVVLVDDVLYTGRTIRAALDALMDLGRPKMIQLAVLIDRGHRELPIKADYVGKNVPSSKREVIEVRLTDIDNEEQVMIMEFSDEE